MALTAPDVDSYVSTSGRTIEPNLGYEWVEIAQIVLESDLQTSLFADERLFFAHAKLQIDRTYWDDSWILPDKFTDPRDNDDDSKWLLGVPENTYWKPQNVDEGYSLFMEALEVGSGCPFQWLLDLVSESESTADDL